MQSIVEIIFSAGMMAIDEVDFSTENAAEADISIAAANNNGVQH